MAERLNAAVLKTVVGVTPPGFESLSLRTSLRARLDPIDWRDGRVAECTSLLRTRLGNWTEGSNPSLSVPTFP